MQRVGLSTLPNGTVIYQIYPRSFQDADGNGVGDLPGIISRLGYLSELGVDYIWLSPIYPSPMVDFGYDVADYYHIDPLFGTLKDFDELVKKAHAKKIGIVLDVVFNHTSDQHPWFQESRRSRNSTKRDWYIWHDGRADGPPNNWLSIFGGSAWQFDQATGQYYLHSFATEQPDLNWQNPEVREELKNVLHFWCKRGVDGFRLDAVYWYGKDQAFRNDPINSEYREGINNPYDSLLHLHSKRQHRTYDYLNELTRVIMNYPGRFMVTEAYPHSPLDMHAYQTLYEEVNSQIAAPFNFTAMRLPWEAARFRDATDQFQTMLGNHQTAVNVLGNHDQPRLASRLGKDAAPAAAVWLLTLPGIAVIYYGDEIGMHDVAIPPKLQQDVFGRQVPGLHEDRDPERTPMQWSAKPHAGFSHVTPWLPVASDFAAHNIIHQKADPHSLWHLYKKLIKLRHQLRALHEGNYQPLNLKDPNLFGFVREATGQRVAIIINFSRTHTIPLEVSGETILSTYAHTIPGMLQPLEGRVVLTSPES
jgi:alpha-glucosidase